MAQLRLLALTFTVISTLAAGCKKSEPDIPTFDPMDKVQPREGWSVERSIAVSKGPNILQAHHVQSLASGLHDVDFKTPPKALIPIEPSCKVTRPDTKASNYLIIGNGQVRFPLMKRPETTGLITFDNKTANKLAKEQAISTKTKGVRSTNVTGKYALPSSNMQMTDIFITSTSKPVFLALAGGGLYNFNLRPGAQVSGVVIYTESNNAAVAGLPENTPISFVSKTHKATRGCWTRIQPRPDKTWSKRIQNGKRYEALKPHWKDFEKRVNKDIGNVSMNNIISVYRAGHFLIGPAPTQYEHRIPYVALGGKTIHYLAADHARVDTYENNKAYAGSVLNQYYEAHMGAN